MTDKATQTVKSTTTPTEPDVPVKFGLHTGQVRMFNRFKGYGFITVHMPTGQPSREVFVHQTNIYPVLSSYRTLSIGEYVSLDISTDDKSQALNVRGICGGSLRCDSQVHDPSSVHSQSNGSTPRPPGTLEGHRYNRNNRRNRDGPTRSHEPRHNRGVNLAEFIPDDAVIAVSRPDESCGLVGNTTLV